MSYLKIKSFGKRQKQLLVSVYQNQNQKVLVDNPALRVVLAALHEKKLVIFQAGQTVITELGKQVVETELRDYLREAQAVRAEVALVERRSGNVNFNKKLGKNQKALLLKIRETPLLISKNQSSSFLNHVIASLRNQGLIECIEDRTQITKYGEDILANPVNNAVGRNFSQIANYAQDIMAALFRTEGSRLTKEEVMFLKFISKFPRLVTDLRRTKRVTSILSALKDRDLLEIFANKLWITVKGQEVLNSAVEFYQLINTGEEFSGLFISLQKIQFQKRLLKKGREFFDLHEQGLTYQAIGDLHGISRERVRQYLERYLQFNEYLKALELEEARAIAEKEKAGQARPGFISNHSLRILIRASSCETTKKMKN